MSASSVAVPEALLSLVLLAYAQHPRVSDVFIDEKLKLSLTNC